MCTTSINKMITNAIIKILIKLGVYYSREIDLLHIFILICIDIFISNCHIFQLRNVSN